jgi:hypothetical protein
LTKILLKLQYSVTLKHLGKEMTSSRIAWKTFLALFIIVLLSTMVGAQVTCAEAADSEPEMPRFWVVSPAKKGIYNSNNVTLSLTIEKPDSWFTSYYGTFLRVANGEVTFVQYNLDGKKSENMSVNDPWNLINPPHSLNFASTLSELSEGQHTINVSVYGRVHRESVVSSSPEIMFFVDAVPLELSIITPESVIYNVTDVPLEMVASEPVSWMGYSLDDGDRVTFAENTTLMNLTAGLHSLTVFANDTIGNFASSETITFTVAKPVTQEPLPVVPVAAVSVAAAVTTAAGLLVYFKKRKEKSISNSIHVSAFK